MLHHVRIHAGLTAKECENEINEALETNQDYETSYEMLIESSILVGNISNAFYTLLLNFEEREQT